MSEVDLKPIIAIKHSTLPRLSRRRVLDVYQLEGCYRRQFSDRIINFKSDD